MYLHSIHSNYHVIFNLICSCDAPLSSRCSLCFCVRTGSFLFLSHAVSLAEYACGTRTYKYITVSCFYRGMHKALPHNGNQPDSSLEKHKIDYCTYSNQLPFTQIYTKAFNT